MSFHRLLAFSLCLACAAFTGGCASDEYLAKDPLKLDAASTRSAVALSITTNTGQISGFDNIEVTRILAPGVTESGFGVKTYTLRRVAPDMARDTALFVGSLPPAEYMFTSFSSNATGKVLKVGKENLLGNFTVHAGMRVDLGRLLLTPVNRHVVVGRMEGAASNLSMIARFSPEHAEMFSSKVEAGWNGPGRDASGFTAYALRSPVGADCPTERDDGTVIAASRLGSVLIRSKQGRWRAVRGTSVESLLCVLPVDLPDAELLAVGEFGTLLRKPRGMDTLVPVDIGNLPPGNLLNIAGNPASGWIIAHKAGHSVTLYRSARLEGGNWTPLVKEEIKSIYPHGGSGFYMWRTKAGIAYAVARGQFKYLDFASSQWTERWTPSHFPLGGLTVAPNGNLGAFVMLGAIVMDYTSSDDAVTWQQIKPSTHYRKMPALALNDGALLMVTGSYGKEMAEISRDGGKTWTQQGQYQDNRTILPLKSGELLDFDKGQLGFFSINRSVDSAKTWTLEHSTFDVAAYDRQQKDEKK